jgi:DNA-binding CsgD family transcriptional regulator
MSADLVSASPETQTAEPKKIGRAAQLTHRKLALLLQLADEGKNTVEIAKVLGCSDSTVGRTLDKWADSRPIARRLLERKADKLARTVINTKNADVALRALGKLDVVREDQQHSASVTVMVGINGAPLASPVPPQIIEVSPSPQLVTGETE